jgi:TonB-linked SusC/RagA family outer membrane protein
MKKKLLVIFVLSFITINCLFAQDRRITGTVVGAGDKAPLPGVSVTIKGTNRGSITDGDGKFIIAASTGEILQFTFIGYDTFMITITASGDYHIELQTDIKLLNEVVVIDSYGTQAKKSYTGAASTVNGAENENKPFASPLQALQGEVPGLYVSSFSGQPGADIQVRLRGVNSLAVGLNPLYVIDGAIVNAGDISQITTTTSILSGLNNDDIASITVLKDASATAIYGSRGSNGVIVITTKKGRAGKTQIRIDAESGYTANLPIPEAGRPATAAQYSVLFKEGLINAGIPADTVASLANSYGLNGRSNDWYNLVTRIGQQQQYNVSASGGGDNTKIFASAGYFKQQATTIGSDLTRITSLLNVDHIINKRLSFNVSANVSNVNQDTPYDGITFANPILAAFYLRPFQLAKNPDGTINTDVTSNTGFNQIYNPLYTIAHDVKHQSETRALGSGSIKWNIWDQLNFTSFASADYVVLEEHIFDNPLIGDGAGVNGTGYDNYDRVFNYSTRNQLDYRYNIPSVEDFYVDVTAGYEAQKSAAYLIATQANGFPLTQPLLTESINAAVPITGNATISDYTFDALYSRVNFNFKNKYSLSGSFRRDGSSEFGADKRYGDFYSVGGAWNLDQEHFFKDQKIFSSVKFRSSFGTTGNAQFSSTNTIGYVYLAQSTAGYNNNYAGNNGQNFNNLGNPNLTWESSQKFDVGVNFGFFNDRLVFDADYYHDNINKLIQSVPVSLTTGFGTILANIGAMVNKGYEFAVKGKPIISKDFTWTTDFNISLNKNTVTSLFDGESYVNYLFHTEVGKDQYTWYSRLYAGVDPANGDALWYTDASKTTKTDNYNAAERVDTRQADPKAFGGFSNSFNYKGIILTVDFYYNYGNYIQASPFDKFFTDGQFYTGNKFQYIYTNRWTHPGQVTNVPKYVAGGIILADGTANQESAFSDRFLYNGSFIRLKNLTIGYDLKNIAFLKNLGVSKLYLYGRGTNLWTKTYDKNLTVDPEVGTEGVGNLDIPQVKTFTIGLNVGL